MSKPCNFARAEEARQAGWLSRRYQSSGDRDKTIIAREAKIKAERIAASAHADIAYKRTPKERLKWLDDNGFRAVRERARLEVIIAKA